MYTVIGELRKFVARLAIAFAFLLFGLLNIVTFVPGAQVRCAFFATTIALIGLLDPVPRVREIAIAVAGVLLVQLLFLLWIAR